MTKVSGQLEGRHALREGYLTDSMGQPIDPGALYNYEGMRWTEVTAMWRMGTKKPKECKPINRVSNG